MAVHDCSTNDLVAYMLENYDGSLGLLRVHPDHQRKGLALAVIGELASKVMKASGYSVSIRADSEVSQKVHQKCGFRMIDNVVWLYYTPSKIRKQ